MTTNTQTATTFASFSKTELERQLAVYNAMLPTDATFEAIGWHAFYISSLLDAIDAAT